MISYNDDWVIIQHKTFIRWINNHLQSNISDLSKDLSSGVILCQLIAKLSQVDTLRPIYLNPKFNFQKFENLNEVLEFLRYLHIPILNIGAEDIVEGNLKLILGLIWSIFVSFTLTDSTISNLDGTSFTTIKSALLDWVNSITKRQDIKVSNFHKDWNDGLALSALLSHFKPKLLTFKTLNRGKIRSNIENALDIATELGIPKLIDVDDFLVLYPDEKSIIAYAIEWYKFFEMNKGKKEDEKESEVEIEKEEEEIIPPKRPYQISRQSSTDSFKSQSSAKSTDSFVIEEAKQVITNKPKKLSIKELTQTIQQKLTVGEAFEIDDELENNETEVNEIKKEEKEKEIIEKPETTKIETEVEKNGGFRKKSLHQSDSFKKGLNLLLQDNEISEDTRAVTSNNIIIINSEAANQISPSDNVPAEYDQDTKDSTRSTNSRIVYDNKNLDHIKDTQKDDQSYETGHIDIDDVSNLVNEMLQNTNPSDFKSLVENNKMDNDRDAPIEPEAHMVVDISKIEQIYEVASIDEEDSSNDGRDMDHLIDIVESDNSEVIGSDEDDDDDNIEIFEMENAVIINTQNSYNHQIVNVGKSNESRDIESKSIDMLDSLSNDSGFMRDDGLKDDNYEETSKERSRYVAQRDQVTDNDTVDENGRTVSMNENLSIFKNELESARAAESDDVDCGNPDVNKGDEISVPEIGNTDNENDSSAISNVKDSEVQVKHESTLGIKNQSTLLDNLSQEFSSYIQNNTQDEAFVNQNETDNSNEFNQLVKVDNEGNDPDDEIEEVTIAKKSSIDLDNFDENFQIQNNTNSSFSINKRTEIRYGYETSHTTIQTSEASNQYGNSHPVTQESYTFESTKISSKNTINGFHSNNEQYIISRSKKHGAYNSGEFDQRKVDDLDNFHTQETTGYSVTEVKDDILIDEQDARTDENVYDSTKSATSSLFDEYESINQTKDSVVNSLNSPKDFLNSEIFHSSNSSSDLNYEKFPKEMLQSPKTNNFRFNDHITGAGKDKFKVRSIGNLDSIDTSTHDLNRYSYEDDTIENANDSFELKSFKNNHIVDKDRNDIGLTLNRSSSTIDEYSVSKKENKFHARSFSASHSQTNSRTNSRSASFSSKILNENEFPKRTIFSSISSNSISSSLSKRGLKPFIQVVDTDTEPRSKNEIRTIKFEKSISQLIYIKNEKIEFENKINEFLNKITKILNEWKQELNFIDCVLENIKHDLFNFFKCINDGIDTDFLKLTVNFQSYLNFMKNILNRFIRNYKVKVKNGLTIEKFNLVKNNKEFIKLLIQNNITDFANSNVEIINEKFNLLLVKETVYSNEIIKSIKFIQDIIYSSPEANINTILQNVAFQIDQTMNDFYNLDKTKDDFSTKLNQLNDVSEVIETKLTCVNELNHLINKLETINLTGDLVFQNINLLNHLPIELMGKLKSLRQMISQEQERGIETTEQVEDTSISDILKDKKFITIKDFQNLNINQSLTNKFISNLTVRRQTQKRTLSLSSNISNDRHSSSSSIFSNFNILSLRSPISPNFKTSHTQKEIEDIEEENNDDDDVKYDLNRFFNDLKTFKVAP